MNQFANLPVPAANGSGVAVDVSGMGAIKTIVVGGPFQGAVTIEYATDDVGAVWAPVPNGTFNSSPGRVTIELAVRWMRATMAAYKGGAANADVGGPSDPGGAFFAPLSAVPVDISAFPPFKTVVSAGPGICEVSEDGTRWSQVFAFQAQGGQSGVVVAKFARSSGAAMWIGAADLGDDDADIIPPFNPTNFIIYANVTGSDATGSGSQLNPYRTFQRAVRDVPAFIPPGARYKIDITNLGDETLPDGYELPAWAAGDFIFPFPSNAVSIVADLAPVVALAPSARVFTPTSTAQNPIAKVWSVEDLSQAWPVLKGKYLVWGDPDDSLCGVIHENTGTEIEFSGDETPFGEMTIMEPTARLLGNWQIVCSASLFISGVAILPANPGDGSVTIANCQTWMERCTVEGSFFAAPVYRHYTFNCDLIRPAWNGPFYVSGCRVTDFEFESFEAPPYMIFKSGTVFENIGTISPVNLDPRWHFGANLLMDAVLIKSALGNGVFFPGGVGVIGNVEANNCGENAFHFKGPGKYTLSNVGGTGSAGVGVLVEDGAQVECTTLEGAGDSLEFFPDDDGVVVLTDVGAGFKEGMSSITIVGATTPANNGTFGILGVIDPDNVVYANPAGVTEVFPGTWVIDPVNVTGAGGDQQVGDLGPAAWPAIPFNLVDWTYDPTGGSPAQVTGTGGRLFNQ